MAKQFPLGDPGANVTVLGVLSVLWSACIILGGLFVGFIITVGGALFGDAFGESWIRDAAAMVGMFVIMGSLVVGTPLLAAGIGLFKRRPWARILTLIVATLVGLFGIFALMGEPLSGILSILYAVYAYFVLLHPAVAALFGQGSSGQQQQQQTVVVVED